MYKACPRRVPEISSPFSSTILSMTEGSGAVALTIDVGTEKIKIQFSTIFFREIKILSNLLKKYLLPVAEVSSTRMSSSPGRMVSAITS